MSSSSSLSSSGPGQVSSSLSIQNSSSPSLQNSMSPAAHGRIGNALASLHQSLSLVLPEPNAKSSLVITPTLNRSYTASGELLSPGYGDVSTEDDLASITSDSRQVKNRGVHCILGREEGFSVI